MLKTFLSSEYLLLITLCFRLREQAKQFFRPDTFVRFLKGYKEHTAVGAEADLQEIMNILPVEECRFLRRENSASRPYFSMNKACHDLDLPDEVFEH